MNKLPFFVFLLLPSLLLAACQEEGLPLPIQPTNTPIPAVLTAVNPPTSQPIQQPATSHAGIPNHLIDEKSPYLQQHAYNPIDWYPWGEEAFAKAEAEGKLIFLSIGYSTCHWCHVMEDESFSQQDVGVLMNEAFISIKVDREERPDIDAIYMQVAQMLNGSGGWPLNVIMTPDQKPFFATTYIPKETRFERMGLMELVPRVQEVWATQRDDLIATSNQIVEVLENAGTSSAVSSILLDSSTLDAAYDQLASRFDPVNGGFGSEPKFPSPHNLLFLLRYWDRSGNEQALAMVEATLRHMRQGGIYDQVGFGFHRYSTDAEWLTPHFEKMLYDQAMLAIAYVETAQASNKPEFEQTAREIFTYVLRDMTAAEGGFYSAEDADSEGEEGKFYLWQAAEIGQVVSTGEAIFVEDLMNVENAGNFQDEATGQQNGANIFHLSQPLNQQEAAAWEPIRQQLFAAREQRIHPSKDDKILTDWNGLMIAALAKAGPTFNEPAYIAAAITAADFLLAEMVLPNGRLLHRYKDGEAAIAGTIDDYVFFVWGLLELYEATFDLRYLESAIAINDQMLAHFWDDANGGLYFTADDAEQLLTRPKESYDGAIPSGNSAAMLNLLRLGRITGNTEYEVKAKALSQAFAGNIQQSPTGYAHLLSALNFGIGPSYEVVIVGEPGAADTEALLEALRGEFVPNKVVLLRPPADDAPITQLAEFTKYQYSLDGKATAYVCLNYFCKEPTTDVNTMLTLLRERQ